MWVVATIRGQCGTRPWGVDTPVGLCQYNIINTGPDVSTACTRAQRRGKPNLGWGKVGEESVSGTAPFNEFWRRSRNWPGKKGHLSEGSAYEKAWKCGNLQCYQCNKEKGTGEGRSGDEGTEVSSPCIFIPLFPQVFSPGASVGAKVRSRNTLGHIVSPSHRFPLCHWWVSGGEMY